MPYYDELREHCETDRRVSSPLIDEFLQPYAAKKDGLIKEYNSKMKPFRHLSKELLTDEFDGMFLGQFVCHRIFKKDGLIHKYLKHSEIKSLSPEEIGYLEFHSEHPWFYCYSTIVSSPEVDFYHMEDIMTGKQFLVYSPAITRRKKSDVKLWFGLYRFNGKCSQTVGIISGFFGFDADDIFYFATERNENIESVDDIVADIDNNPVPYTILALGADYPVVLTQGEDLVNAFGDFEATMPDLDRVKKFFRMETNDGIIKLSLKNSTSTDYSSDAYYDEEEKSLFVFGTSENRYAQLAANLIEAGFEIPLDPDVIVHPTFLFFLEMAFKMDPQINPYEDFFERAETNNQEMVEKMNHLMQLALPLVNAGEELDVASLASTVGLDYQTAKAHLASNFSGVPQLKFKPFIDTSMN